jgi:hypothetical protein
MSPEENPHEAPRGARPLAYSEKLDPLVISARREAIATMLVWLAAVSYTVPYCYIHGYNRDPKSLTFVLGFPDWIFWGLMVPWIVCWAISGWFAFYFIQDEDMGPDLNGDEDQEGAL